MARSCLTKKKPKCDDSDWYSSSDDQNDGDTGCKKKKKVDKCREKPKCGADGGCFAKLSKLWCRLKWQTIMQTLLFFATVCVLAASLWLFGGPIWSLLNIFSSQSAIEKALAKYDADRLGIADYALESSGASVLCSSDTYYSTTGALYSVFGIPIWYHTSSPRAVIQPEMNPGKCWAMHGQSGYVTIQLAMPIIVNGVSLEHIPEVVAPTGRLDTAPRDFVIVGKEKTQRDPEIVLGRFTYDTNGKPIQKFEIKDPQCTQTTKDSLYCNANDKVFKIITLKILSNQGNPNYTCIYRLRVHGIPALD